MGFTNEKDSVKKHGQAEFKNDVLQYYDAAFSRSARCVVSGLWFDKGEVKAAHLVPGTLSPEELSFRFGAYDTVASKRQNGLPVHRNVEVALDRGQICIVPMAPLNNSAPRWKCILLDEGCRHNTALAIGGKSVTEITWDVCISLPHIWCSANVS